MLFRSKHYADLNAKGFVNKTGTDIGRQRALTKFLLNNPADLVIGVNIGHLYDAFAAASDKLRSSKIVMTMHAIEDDYFADVDAYASMLDGIITTNRLTEALVNARCVLPKQRVLYAAYGVDEGPTRAPSSALPLRIAWAGRLENSQKRASDLLSILLELDHANCDYQIGRAHV